VFQGVTGEVKLITSISKKLGKPIVSIT